MNRTMELPISRSANAQIDELLEEICVALQITDTLYDQAKERYKTVGKWLSAEGSFLASLQPNIYPQGSARLGTTVKPRHQEEHDVDLICHMEIPPNLYPEPGTVLNLVEARLNQSGHYKGKVEPYKRCVRINYANEFHLDITPARRDPSRSGSCILVPDRKIKQWKPSNPIGYAEWFERQTDREKRAMADRKIAPFPAQEPAKRKGSLRRAVQLLKRHRDIVFDGSDDAPRSIALTTLAGHHYEGQDLTTDALMGILDNVADYIERTPGAIEIPNPSNNAEKLCESWQNDPEAYDAFVEFIRQFRRRFRSIIGTTGLDRIADRLNDLFGEKVTRKAVASLTERVNQARAENQIHYGGTLVGISASTPSTRPVPPNTFYGR